MSETANRRKTIILFFLIALFGFFASKKTTNFFPNKSFNTHKYIVSHTIRELPREVDLVENIFFEVDNQLNPIKVVTPSLILREGDVLGVDDCQVGDIIYSSRKICTRPMGSMDHSEMRENRSVGVGERIRRDAKIWLIEVEVPPLLSGSPVMDSSVRQIHVKEDGTPHWTLRPAGEMINREVVEGNMYPGDERSKAVLDGAQEARNIKFGLQYRMGVSGEGAIDGDDDSSFTVYQYHENDCMEDCRNNPNPTPTHHLVNSNTLVWGQNYPQYYNNLDEVQAPEIIDDCEDNVEFLDMNIDGNTAVACTPSIFQVFMNFFKNITSGKLSADCSAPMVDQDGEPIDQDPCVSVADIIVIMESPWGTKRDCTDIVEGKCVTEFNDMRRGGFNPPANSSQKNYYVLTRCVINVEELGGGYSAAKQVKCAWDIDYIVTELEFQSYDNITSEEYPDVMDYLEFHVEESENREDPVFEM